jgi:mRNA-degrading endonuclease RelE of RelBE toxin-antitoxin system
MKFQFNLKNSCIERKPFCVNCHNHFMSLRPKLKEVVVSRHFIKDLKDEAEVNSIIQDVLSCSNSDFTELHKFEEHIDGLLVFRAKKMKLHIIYCIDKRMRIIFLRAFKNFNQYKKFLNKKNPIKHMIKMF